jgi:NAD(P)-dependent dehydrogenase (short-subunit alcohol dehydrogenase family)
MASKVVLITGANTGIGYQIVRALCSSSHAYDVIVGGRSPDKVQDAISAAQKEFPDTKSKLSPIQVDIESDDSITKAFGEVKSKFGKLDVLVNNAGMAKTTKHQEALLTKTLQALNSTSS